MSFDPFSGIGFLLSTKNVGEYFFVQCSKINCFVGLSNKSYMFKMNM
jgi:hypothetical protein